MKTFAKFLLFGLCILSLFAVLNSELREHIHGYFTSDAKEVLASMPASDLLGDGQLMKILKVRTKDGLWLEIYNTKNDGKPPLVEKILMPDKSDGYFRYQGEPTNLALEDLNGDRKLEIIAPSFDAHLTAHLNVYTYNNFTKKYELADPDEFPLEEEQ